MDRVLAMHVTITGGTGLIGSRLTERLRARGDAVTVVSRDPDGPDQVGWDVTTPGSLTLPAATDAVVHLAGAPIVDQRWTESYKQELRTSRTEGTQRVVEAVLDHGDVDHVVSGSAVGYYGDRGDETLTEDNPPGEDFLASVCQAWEEAAREIAETGEVATTLATIRTGIVLSPDDGALAQMLNPFWFVKPFHWGLGGPLGRGEQWFPWIHVEDEVRAIVHLIDEQLEGPFNLAAPGIVRNKAFMEAIGDALNRPAKLPLPKVALWLLYGEAADVLFASQRVVPERLQKTGFTFEHPDPGPALEDLLGDG